MNLLDVKNIEAGYRTIAIVKNVSLSVKKGEIAVLIGPNGAGKSTLLRTIFGLANAQKGKVFFDGKDVTNKKPNELVKEGIGFVPQWRRVFGEMTTEENLEMGGFLVQNKEEVKKRLGEIYALFPRLKQKGKQRAMLLSGGE